MKHLTLCCVILLCQWVNCQEYAVIGYAYQSFPTCDDNILSMSRLIGLPPIRENYWDGLLDLRKWPNLTEVRLSITVDNPATIEINETLGRVTSLSNNTFYLRTFDQPPKDHRVEFTIRGKPHGPFINVEKIVLNGVVICNNPKKWDVKLYYTQSFAQTQKEEEEKPKCGKRLVPHHSYIANGYPSEEGAWPWHAALYHVNRGSSRYACGGTLLNTKFVLTAAHCLYANGQKLVPQRVSIQLGKHSLRVKGSHGEEFPINQIIIHDDYNNNDLQHDIALLYLGAEVEYNDFIFPVCMWDRDKTAISDLSGENGIVVGWGLDQFDKASDILTQARMPVVSLSTCLTSNREFFGTYLSDSNYCAGFRNGTSVCNGDSGGGMYFEQDDVYRLRGIVSLSVNRGNQAICNAEEYVIFTDVAKYLNWIDDVMLTLTNAK